MMCSNTSRWWVSTSASPGPVLAAAELDPVTARVLEAAPTRGGAGPATVAVSAGVALDTTLSCLGLLAAGGFVVRGPRGWRLAGKAVLDSAAARAHGGACELCAAGHRIGHRTRGGGVRWHGADRRRVAGPPPEPRPGRGPWAGRGPGAGWEPWAGRERGRRPGDRRWAAPCGLRAVPGRFRAVPGRRARAFQPHGPCLPG